MCCFFCKTEESQLCENCKAISSCSEHKKYHRHQNRVCFPWKIEKTAEKGRFLVAAKDIQTFELIHFESTSLFGPLDKSYCCKCLIKTENQCRECSTSVCIKCQEQHLEEEECGFFRKFDGGHILAMRMLLNREKAGFLNELESHSSMRETLHDNQGQRMGTGLGLLEVFSQKPLQLQGAKPSLKGSNIKLQFINWCKSFGSYWLRNWGLFLAANCILKWQLDLKNRRSLRNYLCIG